MALLGIDAAIEDFGFKTIVVTQETDAFEFTIHVAPHLVLHFRVWMIF